MLFRSVRMMENALGDGIKKVESSENETRIIQRRGIWTIKNILKGEKFTKLNVSVLRPTLGVPASRYASVIGKLAKRDYEPYEPIKERDL